MNINNKNYYDLGDDAIYSAGFASMMESVLHAKGNKLTLDYSSKYYKIDDTIVFGVNILKKYEHIIKNYLIDYQISKDLFYRPEYVSYDVYGTTDLWYLVLFVNDIMKPVQLNYSNIKLFDPSYINIINDIIEKESEEMFNYENPKEIKRELLKDLNSPSNKIVSKDYNKKIKPRTPTKISDKKSDNLDSLDGNFKEIGDYRINGKIRLDEYDIIDAGLGITNLTNSTYSDYLALNESDFGLPESYKKNFRKEFNGFIYSKEDKELVFKPMFFGENKFWLDDKLLFSSTSDNFSINENIFETQSKNSDFKLGNTDGWEIINGELIEEDENYYLTKELDEEEFLNIANVNIDVSDLKSYFDIVISTTYKTNYQSDLNFSGARVKVIYSDDTEETHSYDGEKFYFNNNGNFTKISLPVNIKRKVQIKSLDIDFPAKGKGVVTIKSLEVQPIRLKDFKINLKQGWNQIKVRYDSVEQPNSYFSILESNDSGKTFKSLDRNIFNSVSDMKINEIDNSSEIEIYDKHEQFLFKIYKNGLDFNNIQNIISNIYSEFNLDNNQLIIKSNLFIVDPKIIIESNSGDYIRFEIDNEYITEKNLGEERVEFNLDNKYLNQNVSIKIYCEINSNDNYLVLNADYRNLKVINSPKEWKMIDNSITTIGYKDGVSNYVYDGNLEFTDHRIFLNISPQDLNKRGNISIIFRYKNEKEYYLYTIKRDNSIEDEKDILLSGLYKISPDYSEINIDKGKSLQIRGKFLASTKQTYNNNKLSIFITLFNNKIRVYDKIGGFPLVEYTDNKDPFLKGKIGFQTINQSDVIFDKLEITY
ncbi:hypothetical protein Bp8pS_049 [Bacillus phage vB_BpuM-BpSp]|nr:hypothetical protein Bp8pS_049 [Bacillus phage vB_BpuM-BpSp]